MIRRRRILSPILLKERVPDPIFTLGVPDAVARVRLRGRALGAYVSTRLEDALLERPERGALAGVPFGLKDQWETTVLPTTAGSVRYEGRRPTEDGPVYKAFRDAGAVLIGKTNLSDLGLAPEASSYLGGPTRNPNDLSRTAGGSSGGAAAAVADGMQAFDWGTDIGGSVRMPAALCGVMGMRLSSEAWPIRGMFPKVPQVLSWMLGQGPIAKSTAQLRALLDVARPSLCASAGAPFSIAGAVLHIPRQLGKWPSFASEVTGALAPHVSIASASLPRTTDAMRVFSGLWASNLEALLDSDPDLSFWEGLSAVLSSVFLRGALGDLRMHPSTAELLALIALGRATIFRSAKTWQARADAIRASFQECFARGLIVVAPTCVYPAPKIGRTNYNPFFLDCAVCGNIADATGLALPFGRFDCGMPRSLQLMGPPGSELALLELADALLAGR